MSLGTSCGSCGFGWPVCWRQVMGRICLFVKYKLRSFGCASCSLKGVFTSIPHTDSKPLECQWDILLTSRGSDGLEMGCHWQHIHHHTSRSILSGFVNFLFNQPFAFPGAEPYSISRYAVAGLVLAWALDFKGTGRHGFRDLTRSCT